MSKQERVILFLLAGLNFTHFLDFMVMMPLGSYLIPYFRISAREFSILVSAYSISAAVSGFLIAFIVDRMDRKRVLLLSYFGFVVGTLVCGFASSYPLLLAARIVAGLFGGVIGAQVLAIIADLFSYERRGKAMSSVTASFAVASILGVPLALKLTDMLNDDWHVPFLVVGGVGFVMLLLALRFIPKIAGHMTPGIGPRRPILVLKQVISSPTQRLSLLFSFLLMIAHFMVIPFIAPYLQFNKGYESSLIRNVFLAGGTAALIAAVILGILADRRGKLPVFVWTTVCSMVMVIIITQLPQVPVPVVLIFFSLWFAFVTGRSLTAQAMISETVPASVRGSFMSFNGCVQQAGTGVASLLAGFIVISDKTGHLDRYEWLGYLSIAILIACLWLSRLLFHRFESKPASEPVIATASVMPDSLP